MGILSDVWLLFMIQKYLLNIHTMPGIILGAVDITEKFQPGDYILHSLQSPCFKRVVLTTFCKKGRIKETRTLLW